MIRPLKKNVLLREVKPPTHSKADILLPDIASHIYPEFSVVAAGPDADPAIQPNARVVLDQFRLGEKIQAGPGLWLVRDNALAIVIPNASRNQT